MESLTAGLALGLFQFFPSAAASGRPLRWATARATAFRRL